MNLIWRFLYTIITSRFQKKVSLFEVTRTRFRVLPTDIDILLHMNNGRYFSMADLARLNYIMRHKNFSIYKKNKILAVIASEMMRFTKSLKCWIMT